MPELDTDSSMMREQQDRDTPQSIGDETSNAGEGSDSDAGSRADREAAKAGSVSESGPRTQDVAVENGQTTSAGRYDIAAMKKAALARGASLVRRGRSLLGN